MSAPPRLWLACGLCGKAPNLACITPPVLIPVSLPPRLTSPARLPGEMFTLRERDGVSCVIRPGRAGDGFTYYLTCPNPVCRRTHQFRSDRAGEWWREFLATRRSKDRRYLGRDR